MIDYQAIIDHYYPEAQVPELRNILITHSRQVADKAVSIVDAHPELGADRDFVYAAAMLHDIGIIRCDAPGIHCHGTEPYIRHGVEGARMIEAYPQPLPEGKGDGSVCNNPLEEPLDSDNYCASGLPSLQGGAAGMLLARVCARHTGTGLPGLEPETVEEKIICYADKFFSKTKLDREKTFEEACRSLMKFGEEGVRKFESWHEKFG
jgi:uncharacterized protein